MYSIRRKVVPLGDAEVGKTLLLHMLQSGGIPLVYEPTVCKYCFPLLHILYGWNVRWSTIHV